MHDFYGNFDMSRSETVHNSSRYQVIDRTVGDLMMSTTILRGDQETRGHQHSHDEIIMLPIWGHWEFRLGDEKIFFDDGFMTYRSTKIPWRDESVLALIIPGGIFHQVVNQHNIPITFVNVWQGVRDGEASLGPKP